MPQFLFIDLPNFRLRDAHGHGVSLSYKQLGQIIAQYQYVRSGLRSIEYADLCASLVFAAGETDIWTSYTTSTTTAAAPPATSSSSSRGHGSGSRNSNSTAAAVAATAETTTMVHAEENMLLAYHQSFDSPGAYPIVDALLLSSKPCSNCLGYFVPPLTLGQDPTVGYELWMQLGGMWAADFIAEGTLASSPDVARGQMYYLMMMQEHGGAAAAPWFALNGQETMTDAEVAEAISRQGVAATYWIGR
ncbi:hypothetical protein PG990_004204 [Apiospora arundinis]